MAPLLGIAARLWPAAKVLLVGGGIASATLGGAGGFLIDSIAAYTDEWNKEAEVSREVVSQLQEYALSKNSSIAEFTDHIATILYEMEKSHQDELSKLRAQFEADVAALESIDMPVGERIECPRRCFVQE